MNHLLAIAFLLISFQSTPRIDIDRFYPIKKFIDGDTFWIDDGSQKGIKVRLIGINSPEAADYFDRKEEPYGKEASAHMEKLIGDKPVRLELDVDHMDKYGRLLAYIFLEDSTFINEKMVEDGYAQVATYPPNVKYQQVFVEAQKRARERKAGMWAEER